MARDFERAIEEAHQAEIDELNEEIETLRGKCGMLRDLLWEAVTWEEKPPGMQAFCLPDDLAERIYAAIKE